MQQPPELTQTNLPQLLRGRYGEANNLHEYTRNTKANLGLPLLVCFGNFNESNEELLKDLDHFEALSREYVTEITFAVGNMSELHIFRDREEDDAKIEKHIHFHIFGEDDYGKYGFPNNNHTLWKRFCKKLRNGQMWQADVLNDAEHQTRNLYSIMDESDKNDVFVFFFDPKCPNSASDLEILQKLAHQLAEDPVVIVAFNTSENTWGVDWVYIEYNVECYLHCYGAPSGLPCYPSLFLLDNNGDTDTFYGSTERTLESFRNFIARNTKNELTHYRRDGTKKDL